MADGWVEETVTQQVAALRVGRPTVHTADDVEDIVAAGQWPLPGMGVSVGTGGDRRQVGSEPELKLTVDLMNVS